MKKLLLSLAVVLTAASLGIGDDAEKDLKKLTGTWEEVSHVADGKAKTADEVMARRSSSTPRVSGRRSRTGPASSRGRSSWTRPRSRGRRTGRSRGPT